MCVAGKAPRCIQGKTGIIVVSNNILRGDRMISFDYKPQGVCARNIHLDLSDDGNKVIGVEFTGGCDGNLKAISKLVEGAPADRVIEVLAGNTCGMKKTSCADQLTRAIEAARAEIA